MSCKKTLAAMLIAMVPMAYTDAAEVSFGFIVSKTFADQTTTWDACLVDLSDMSEVDNSPLSISEVELDSSFSTVTLTFETGTETGQYLAILYDDDTTPNIAATRSYWLSSGSIINPRPAATNSSGQVRSYQVDGFASGAITAASITDGAITDAKVANDVQVDVVSISADSTAADNLELITEIQNITSLVVSAGGAVDSLLQGFVNSTIAETTADRIAGNFEVFYDNANALTTAVVDDVGSGGGGGLTEADVRNAVGLASPNLDTQLSTIDTNVDSILVDTGTTLDGAIATVDTNVDSILVDTGTTIPGTISTVDSNVDAILVDTGTDIPATLTSLTSTAGQILTDTGTTLPATLATIDANVDSILVDTGTTLAGDVSAILTDTGTTLPATLATIVADTNELQTDDVPGLIAGLNDLTAAQVNAEVDTALTDIHLDHLFETDYDPATPPGTATAYLNEIAESDGGDTRFTANALENAPTGGLDAAGVRAAVGLAAANLDTQLGTIDSNVDAVLVDTGTTLDAALAVVDTNVDAILVDTSTTLAGDLTAILADTNELQADWADAGRLDTILDGIATDTGDIAAILADTNELQGDWTNAGRLDTILDDILEDTTALEVGSISYATPDKISSSRTWYVDDYRANNQVELNAWSSGSITLAFDLTDTLNPGTTVASFSTATVTNDVGGGTTATSNLGVQQNRRAVSFSCAAISSASTHTVEATVLTTDGQTIVVTGKLRVY